ncbi:MerR family transcriptional regulator [Acidaminobacter hydrogenoformans]|uniref:DNA-binding transcriptional regulator, MerR family n=1 Tax=Acidaminobacter hydrogenoformans DSM 2784 TaxID=1120920 RepID=A0A1G5RRK7_9FIRM|nr:MerR family transcriptional regulator [Acidaminobacter hydrogenoformans]SCZ76490.1 DNA-binding transcriptional regulator, MerR family [Acidaminobacter hydrogenoformans DSM 2784]
MRIGEFSTRTGVTVDTLRHYMELGLLVVEKRGGQYDFDEHVQKDLERILQLKEMGFSLAEVKRLFQFERLGAMTDYQKDVYYCSLFSERIHAVRLEIEARQKALAALEEATGALVASSEVKGDVPRQAVGLPLEALPLLACRRCGGDLSLHEGEILEGRVLQGKLICSGGCGEAGGLVVEAGIVYVPELWEAQRSEFEVRRKAIEASGNASEVGDGTAGFLEAYLMSTDPAYLDRIYEGLSWVRSRADFTGCRAALELGSGHGFYLRTVYDQLPETMIYVAVDHDPERHRFLKTILEGAAQPRKLVLLCADFQSLPLKADSFDVLMDFTGTSNYSFDNDGFLPDIVNPLMREKARLFGSYIVFERFGINTRIPADRRLWFTEAGVLEGLAGLGYKLNETYRTAVVSQGGVFEDYFEADERVRTVVAVGARGSDEVGCV